MEYRLYFLSPDCRISSPGQGFQAEDDDTALEFARRVYALTVHHGFELWQSGRRVHTENC